jgi:hypothetical protein
MNMWMWTELESSIDLLRFEPQLKSSSFSDRIETAIRPQTLRHDDPAICRLVLLK